MSRQYYLYTDRSINCIKADKDFLIKKLSLMPIDFDEKIIRFASTEIERITSQFDDRYIIVDPYKNCLALTVENGGILKTVTAYGLNDASYILYQLAEKYNVGFINEVTVKILNIVLK